MCAPLVQDHATSHKEGGNCQGEELDRADAQKLTSLYHNIHCSSGGRYLATTEGSKRLPVPQVAI